MKRVVILGAGTAGTMMANHLSKKLPKKEWELVIIDQEKTHYYQPGFLFLPFDIYQPEDVVRFCRVNSIGILKIKHLQYLCGQ